MVAAGAVVVKDVPAHALVAGVPAKLVGWVCDRGHPVDSKNWCARCGKTYAIPRPASRKRAGSRSRGRSKRRTWDLFFRGARLAAVVRHLRTCWQVAATRRTVLIWVRADARLLAGYVEAIMAERKVHGGRRWHEDLAVVRKGRRLRYVWLLTGRGPRGRPIKSYLPIISQSFPSAGRGGEVVEAAGGRARRTQALQGLHHAGP